MTPQGQRRYAGVPTAELERQLRDPAIPAAEQEAISDELARRYADELRESLSAGTAPATPPSAPPPTPHVQQDRVPRQSRTQSSGAQRPPVPSAVINPPPTGGARKRIVVAAALIFAVVAAIIVIVSQLGGGSSSTAIAGVWTGTYTCAQGLTDLRLIISDSGSGALTATFDFYADPSNPGIQPGSFGMIGTYTASGLVLNPDHWINQPYGDSMVGLTASPPAENKIQGTVTGNQGCTTFSVSK